jgi:hypothetical protein
MRRLDLPRREHPVLMPIATLAALSALPAAPADEAPQRLRPPAIPLVVHDPYFSIWACTDELVGAWPRHWTGRTHALSSMIRVDGRAYRLMGLGVDDHSVAPAKQLSLRVLPTRTIYHFAAGPVEVELSFTTPLLSDDLDILSRPLTYLTWRVRSTDGAGHKVELYYDQSAEAAVNDVDQVVTWDHATVPGLAAVRMGTVEQAVLARDGDDLRIDWGWLYLAAPEGDASQMGVFAAGVARPGFAANGTLPAAEDARKPRTAGDEWPVSAAAMDLGEVGAAAVERFVMVAYDDLYSIQYLGENLRPWWRRDGMEADELLARAAAERQAIAERCAAFDEGFLADAARVGGAEYADLCGLAYRQAIAGHKLVASSDGVPMLFSKECFSNGCVATVDVAYPAAPIFMLFSPELLRALLEPVMRYAATDRWSFPFAPHDLGTYPLANGQRYGGGEATEENQMPVEESGNMLIMLCALSEMEGDTAYADRFAPLLSEWAGYLAGKGLDPANQLCTDDFAGHLAHNANLSLKAIVALACYARICETGGRADEAARYREMAEGFAAEWQTMADDGDHYRLAFDAPGTWSQKYNLVWDRLLHLQLFPAEVAERELAYYRTRLEPYGLPLDNRSLYTKTDWEVWTATLCESEEAWRALMEPVYAFVSATPQRVPLTDWYWTNNAERQGFQARPVIGGVFIKMLADEAAWRKWRGR